MRQLKSEWLWITQGKFIPVMLIAPLIVAAIFGYIFSNSQVRESNVAIIDEDSTAYSQQLIELLNASPYVNVKSVFRQKVDTNKLFYNEDYVAAVYLPEGLEEDHYKGKQATIGMLVDFSAPNTSGNLRVGVQQVIGAQNMQMSIGKLKKLGLNTAQAQGTVAGLSLQQRFLFNPTGDYLNFMVIGFVNVVVLAILIGGTAAIVPRLRVNGEMASTMEQSFSILLRIIPYALISCISLFLSLGVLKQVGGLRFVANPYEFLLPLFIYSSISASLGMLLGWLLPHPSKAGAAIGIVVGPSFLLSGIQVPVALFPQSIQMLSDTLPLTWLFKLIRGMGYRGGDISYFWRDIGVLVVMLGITLFLHMVFVIKELRSFKKKESPTPEVTIGQETTIEG